MHMPLVCAYPCTTHSSTHQAQVQSHASVLPMDRTSRPKTNFESPGTQDSLRSLPKHLQLRISNSQTSACTFKVVIARHISDTDTDTCLQQIDTPQRVVVYIRSSLRLPAAKLALALGVSYSCFRIQRSWASKSPSCYDNALSCIDTSSLRNACARHFFHPRRLGPLKLEYPPNSNPAGALIMNVISTSKAQAHLRPAIKKFLKSLPTPTEHSK